MIDLKALIDFTAPGSNVKVSRSPDGVEGDPWPGIDGWADADYQNALDTLVTWTDGVTPPTGAAVRADIAAWLASLPTQAELDEVARDLEANSQLDRAADKTIRDALWDMELRLRALGSASASPDIADAMTKADYTVVLKDAVKGYLP